jgi:hypothetical protein
MLVSMFWTTHVGISSCLFVFVFFRKIAIVRIMSNLMMETTEQLGCIHRGPHLLDALEQRAHLRLSTSVFLKTRSADDLQIQELVSPIYMSKAYISSRAAEHQTCSSKTY